MMSYQAKHVALQCNANDDARCYGKQSNAERDIFEKENTFEDVQSSTFFWTVELH